jgi:murein L,D-transpeptidase YcbB/YkuD
MTNEERSILVKILSEYDGVLDNGYRWNAVDEMHTEIAPGTSVARVQALQRKLRIDAKGVRAATLPPKQPSPAPKATVSLKASRRAATTDPKAKPGARGTSVSNVRVIETALNKEGLLAKKYLDGSYGTKTVEAYKKWQIRLGFTGDDADGIPGRESLKRLGGKYGFKVVS